MKKVDPKVLLDNNIIDKETFDRILESQNVKKDENQSKKKINILMNIIATVFLVLGIIWICAANWAIFPGWLKLSLGLILTIVSLMYLVINKNENKNMEAASIFYVASLGVFIAIIGQVYNVTPNLSLFFLFLIMILGLISFYSNSWICTSFYTLFISLYFMIVPNVFEVINFTKGTFLDNNRYIGSILTILLFLIIPFFNIKTNNIKLIKHNNEQVRTFKDAYVSLFSIMISVFLFWYGIYTSASYGVMISVIYLINIIARMLNRKTLFKLSDAFILIALFFASIFGVNGFFDSDLDINLILVLIISLVVLFYYNKKFITARKLLKQKMNESLDAYAPQEMNENISQEIKELRKTATVYKLDAVIMGTMFIWPLCNLIEELFTMPYSMIEDITKYFFIIYVIFTSIVFMKNAIKEKLIRYFYLGEMLFALEMLRLLFIVTDELMIKGIISIIVALIILIINKKTAKKLEEKN